MINNKIWFAFYTRSRAEKKVNALLIEHEFETFLPLIKTLRAWSDRKKKVEIPLIPSYIFVKTTIKDYYKVLMNPNVLKVIKIDDKPVPVPESDINNLKILLNVNGDIKTSNKNFSKGEIIELTEGQFKGYKGEVLRKKGKTNLVVFVSALKTTFSLEISSSNVIKVKDK